MSLAGPMAEGELSLEPLTEAHREPLRIACAADPEIWEIYPSSYFGEHFDRSFQSCLAPGPHIPFAIFQQGTLVGMSSFLAVDEGNRSVEIGRTYVVPEVRGGGLNGRVKQLMLARAFGAGLTRVEFRIDTRNARSMAAVEKLGAVREGKLRRNRITLTGYMRDTAVYSILVDEWRFTAG
jgi:RimJ/RimL family protein N-acetyltransferase